jgi:hypothetical protein
MGVCGIAFSRSMLYIHRYEPLSYYVTCKN